MKKIFSVKNVGAVLLTIALFTLSFTDKKDDGRDHLVSVEKVRVTSGADLAVIAETVADMLIVVDLPNTVASATLPFPANPIDGQVFMVSTRSAVTALTLNTNSIPISGSISTLAAGASAGWVYDLASNRWFRHP